MERAGDRPLPDVRYTRSDLSLAISKAREELTGIKSTSYSPEALERHGDSSIFSALQAAHSKAVREGGNEWRQKRTRPSQPIFFDLSHAAGILDAFAENALNIKGKRSEKAYAGMNITREVLERANIMLFVEPFNTQLIQPKSRD